MLVFMGKVLSLEILMWNIKVLSKVNVFKQYAKSQGQDQRVKHVATYGNILSQGILMWNITALHCSKVFSKVKGHKEYYTPNLRSRGHKITLNKLKPPLKHFGVKPCSQCRQGIGAKPLWLIDDIYMNSAYIEKARSFDFSTRKIHQIHVSFCCF